MSSSTTHQTQGAPPGSPKTVSPANGPLPSPSNPSGNPFLPGAPILPTDFLIKSVGPVPKATSVPADR